MRTSLLGALVLAMLVIAEPKALAMKPGARVVRSLRQIKDHVSTLYCLGAQFPPWARLVVLKQLLVGESPRRLKRTAPPSHPTR
jgi:hypothetical protein